jgi:hypothetical protein
MSPMVVYLIVVGMVVGMMAFSTYLFVMAVA